MAAISVVMAPVALPTTLSLDFPCSKTTKFRNYIIN